MDLQPAGLDLTFALGGPFDVDGKARDSSD